MAAARFSDRLAGKLRSFDRAIAISSGRERTHEDRRHRRQRPDRVKRHIGAREFEAIRGMIQVNVDALDGASIGPDRP
jgi:hypothetical protein